MCGESHLRMGLFCAFMVKGIVMRSTMVSARKNAGWNHLRQDVARRRRLLVRKSEQGYSTTSDAEYLAARRLMAELSSEIADLVD